MLTRVLHSSITRRFVTALGTLFGVAVLVFAMLRAIPGDQVTAQFGIESGALTAAQRASLESYYGLDQPLFVQFFSWLGNVLTGNQGFSARSHMSVAELTALSLPVTIELAIITIVFSLLLGVPLGMLSASKPNSARDAFGQVIALAGLSIPAFLLGSSVMAWAASSWGENPNGQAFAQLAENPGLNLRQMILPAAVLAFGIAAPIMRTTRTAVLDVRSKDFIRTARAKGLAPRRIQFRHVLTNALVPITTMTGLQFGYLLGGAIVIEQVFSLPGIGRQVLVGIEQKEYAVVQSTILIIAVCFVLVNLLTDILYRVIDPRVRAL
ncbi:MAG: ABC transporter permease [Bifidobacteriaceae bacterium]|jgi:peptide/nickel transport system permease protein|nr:ABC transporter permease [Bifidobacteriaceae bacterium]